MQTKNKIITSIFTFGLLFSSVLAATISIENNYPSGNYDKTIKIELKASDPKTKIFYGFDPNGTPNDLLEYTGAVTIKNSTPFVFWGFTDYQNESKIYINDYKLQFSNDIRLNTGAIWESSSLKNLSLKNIGNSSIDISNWEIRYNSGIYIIPENTLINSNSDFEITSITASGTISLFSPDGEKKDFIEVLEKISEPKVERTTSLPIITTTQNDIKSNNYINNPGKIQEKSETPKNTTINNDIKTNTENLAENTQTPTNSESTESSISPITGENKEAGVTETPSNTETPKNETPSTTVDSSNSETVTPTDSTTPPTENNLAGNLKNSIGEKSSSSSSSLYIIFGILGVLTLAGIGTKILKK